jgi:hypothetical protein
MFKVSPPFASDPLTQASPIPSYLHYCSPLLVCHTSIVIYSGSTPSSLELEEPVSELLSVLVGALTYTQR